MTYNRSIIVDVDPGAVTAKFLVDEFRDGLRAPENGCDVRTHSSKQSNVHALRAPVMIENTCFCPARIPARSVWFAGSYSSAPAKGFLPTNSTQIGAVECFPTAQIAVPALLE
jgi:hypothetical protein